MTPDGGRYTVQVFPTLRLEDAAFDDASGAYERTALTEVVVMPGIGRIVHRPGLPGGATPDWRVLLELVDPLGSVGSVIDKASSELVQRTTYLPYGGGDSDYQPPRWQGLASHRGFTGNEPDAEVGLFYAGARYYVPLLGRWLSPDPLTIHGLSSDPNAYAYVSGTVSMAADVGGLQACIGFECQGSSGGGGASGSIGGFQIGFGKPDEPNRGATSPAKPVGTPNRTPPPPPTPALPPPNAGWMASVAGFTRALAVNASPVGLIAGLIVDPEQTAMDIIMPRAEIIVGVLGMNYSHVDGSIHHRPDIDGEAAIVAASLVPGPGSLSRLTTLERQAARAEARAAASGRSAISTACLGPDCPCFGAGTKISTGRGLVSIDALVPGDEVLSRNERTGEVALRPVSRVFETPNAEVMELDLRGETGLLETLTVTPGHPFFVAGRGWVAARDLSLEDRLTPAHGGALTVARTRAIAGRQTVFNLEVEDFHTYFVGASAAWVHNTCKVYAGAVGPGKYAGESISLDGPGRNFTDAQREAINRIGVCHTCGATVAKTRSGNFVIDHQPPISLSPGPYRGFPQCAACGLVSGGAASQPHEILRILRIIHWANKQ